MFKRIKKKQVAVLPFLSKWKHSFRRTVQRFCNRLEEHTFYWNKRKKVCMLLLVILFFGGSYTTILVSVFHQKDKKNTPVIQRQEVIKDSISIRKFENLLRGNGQYPKPP